MCCTIPQPPNESDSESSEDNSITIRGKWQMDGAKTIDEAIVKLHEFIDYLREKKNEGWELREEINDDWGFLVRAS